MDTELAALNQKVDLLLEQMEEQKKRQAAADELKNDLIPIANHMVKLSIDELSDLGREFQVEDLTHLLKRVLRDTKLLMKLLDQMESAMGMAEEIQVLSKPVFYKTVEKLDEMERKGYFAFATQGYQILDRIVTEFDEDDVKALGDNIVTILTTVRNMTQPDIMALANNAVNALREPEPQNGTPSTVHLLREMADPQVRKGMARMLNMLKSLADRSETTSPN